MTLKDKLLKIEKRLNSNMYSLTAVKEYSKFLDKKALDKRLNSDNTIYCLSLSIICIGIELDMCTDKEVKKFYTHRILHELKENIDSSVMMDMLEDFDNCYLSMHDFCFLSKLYCNIWNCKHRDNEKCLGC